MEYTKRRRYTVNTEVNDLKEIYPHDLQMYDVPPTGEIPFTEFQELGHDRLKLSRLVENNALRTDLKNLEERKADLRINLKKDGLKYFEHLLFAHGCKSATEIDLQARRKDRLSHFIMRLSYCQNPDRQAWFINQEVEFFRLRFTSLDKEGVEQLLTMHDIRCKQITQDEKDAMREELRLSTPKIASVDTTEFYKVPFQNVIDLVKGRRCYLNEGLAFISQPDLISLFVSYFRKVLIKGAEYAKKYLSNISDDERLTSFLESLPGSFSGMTRVVWSENTTPIEKLDELAKTSYPLCMRTLHEALRTHHHLKNSGRIQYGLFIKGIGVTVEDALRFWKTEFTKKIDADKFDKNYAYSIRHTFGKEGSQKNYTPLGCPKIISSSVAPGEYNGCPYRHMDQDNLRQKLSAYGLPPSSVTEITAKAKEGHYLIACTKYFEIMHNRPPDKPFLHPNAYFMESRAILAKDDPESNVEEKFSQSAKITEKVVGTPRRLDRSTATPSRHLERLNSTPSRNVDINTPSSKKERATLTPVRRIARNTPKKIEVHLNDDEIAELMDEF